MKSTKTQLSAAMAITAVAFCFTPVAQAQSANPSAVRTTEENRNMTADGKKHHGLHASKIIGQDVESMSGDDLGTVKDLAIDAGSGKIAYALISSGGVLGVGDKIHAVPFKALQANPEDRDEWRVAVDKVKWNSAPTFSEVDVLTLTQDERGRSIYEYYGQTWSPMRAANSSGLVLASKIKGRDLRSGTQDVGEIEDVIVDAKSGSASVLIDADDAFAGTNQKYLVSFNKLMPATGEREPFSTSLSREDLAAAKPLTGNAWAGTSSTYVWSEEGPLVRTSDYATDTTRSDRMRERTPVATIRAALKDDPMIADAAKNVTISEDNATLIVTGTVASNDIKERIADKVAAAAKGWNVDDKLTVRSVAE